MHKFQFDEYSWFHNFWDEAGEIIPNSVMDAYPESNTILIPDQFVEGNIPLMELAKDYEGNITKEKSDD